MNSLKILIFFFALSTMAIAQSDVELRVIGGTYEDVASSLVPTPSGGVYALGSTSSHGDGTVRGYVAYFDSDFNYAWSILTPSGSLLENVVDGVLVDGTDDIKILTNKIAENGTYNTTIHHIVNQGNSGEVVSSFEIIDSENQTPIALATWQGNTYAFGDTEGDCWLINIDDEEAVSNADYYMWGHPLMYESVSAAQVINDTLYVVGTTLVEGVEQATLWTWGADGGALWANIGPDENAYGDNYANDIAPFEGGATLLYSYQRDANPIGNGIIRFEEGNGEPNGIVDTSGPYFVEGTRLITHDGGMLKLAQINYNAGAGMDMVLTRLGNYGGYLSSSALGTNFNETPVDMEVGDDGSIWVLGTTYGYLNGSASLCIYKLTSADVIGFFTADEISLGITNDPMLFQSVIVEEENIDLILFPNPAAHATRLTKPASWVLYSSLGKICDSGFGDLIDLSGLRDGLYIVKAEISDKTEVLPLRVVN